MKNTRLFVFCSFLSIMACSPVEHSSNIDQTVRENSGFSFNWEAITQQLIQQADLKVGERVMMVAKPGLFDPLIPLMEQAINETGAIYLGTFSVDTLQPNGWATEFTNTAKAKNELELVDYFSSIDLGVMLPGAVPTDAPYAAMQKVLGNNQGRTIHFHWAGAYDLNGNLLENDSMVHRNYQRALLETDYTTLSRTQEAFESVARDQMIQVTTSAGTDIQFQIGDRPVTKQDGNASASRAEDALNLIDREIELPAGAIRVAPIESSVNGKIAFPDSKWGEIQVEDLVLEFKAGKVVDASAKSGLEGVQSLFEEYGEVAQSFREFALGVNPLLAIPESPNQWIPYYGYGAGVVRLSLGDNTELGGSVTGGYVRWNFFPDATVKVGGDIWVENGKWVK